MCSTGTGPGARSPARLLALLALALALAMTAPGAAAAPGTPTGPVIAVSQPDGFSFAPDVAADAAGSVVVVWSGEAAGQATADVDIYGRRFGPTGAPLGPAFRINAQQAGQQRRPAVALDPSGAFVVAWDTGTSTVWARRFGPDGAPLTPDIAVSQSAATHRDADVAAAADGTFVVAWQLTAQPGEEDLAIRRFDRDGTPLSPERIPYAAAAETDDQINPALAPLPGGRAALIWEEVRPAATAVLLQALDAAGAPAGQPLAVAESTADELRDPAVAAAPDGALVVAWSTYPPIAAGPARTFGVAARSYSPTGAPLGPAVEVAPRDAAERFLPAAAVALDGSAVVAWVDSAEALGAPVGVAARRLTAGGQPEGQLFYPLPPAADAPAASAVAAAIGAAPEAALWIAWAQSPPGVTADASTIYLRRHVERLYSVALPLLRR